MCVRRVPVCIEVLDIKGVFPLEVFLFSPVLMSPAVRLSPPAGLARLPHADVFN